MLNFGLLLFAASCAAQLCGTPAVNLSSLARSGAMFLTPISASNPQYNFYTSLCQAVPLSGGQFANCGGAAICQQWQGASASLGSASFEVFSDLPGGKGVRMTVFNGSPGPNATARSSTLDLLCAQKSDAVPTFVGQDGTLLTYSFVWRRKEACAVAADSCKAVFDNINFCLAAQSANKGGAPCACYNTAQRYFQAANCSSSNAWKVAAEGDCIAGNCQPWRGSQQCDFD
jgi:hypothetical protein